MPLSKDQVARLAAQLAGMPVPMLPGDRLDYVSFARQQVLEALAPAVTLDSARRQPKELRKRPRQKAAAPEIAVTLEADASDAGQRAADVPLSTADVAADE